MTIIQELSRSVADFVKRAFTCLPKHKNTIIFTEHQHRQKRHGHSEESGCEFDDRIIGTITIIALLIFGISIWCCERMRKKTVADIAERRRSIQEEKLKIQTQISKPDKSAYNPGQGGFHAVKFDV